MDLNTPAEIMSKPESIAQSSSQAELSDYVSNVNNATSNINDKSMAQQIIEKAHCKLKIKEVKPENPDETLNNLQIGSISRKSAAMVSKN